jgi:hypothetical protein
MELGAVNRIRRDERRCVAEQADAPELREKLLSLAREWMRAVMPNQDLAVPTGK